MSTVPAPIMDNRLYSEQPQKLMLKDILFRAASGVPLLGLQIQDIQGGKFNRVAHRRTDN